MSVTRADLIKLATVLRDKHGKNIKQIASLMGIKPDTVRKYLKEAEKPAS